MNFIFQLQRFSRSRLSWALLLGLVIFFELCALYFQHVMLLAPCVMCIYERIAMLGIVGAAGIGLINPQRALLRWLGFAGWGYSAYQGLRLSIQHVDYQLNPSPFNTCDLFVTFPSWAPLNQWMPWMFEAYGDCSQISWQLFSLSMPQWLIVIFAGNLLALSLMVAVQFVKQK
ncbi:MULTISPECIES: disulfide bond formation protein DsbB [Vibrio]|uniref:Disulfide bond formation protein B n=1 Tax=Vibrio metschnikovii TaxID=28172 RepID=A0A9X0R6M9_VIBME|nr:MULTISPECIES: disulfide bond formation protein DsbB [Vibrio]EKO3582028.1 disulfide bond formation protein DsbB [Vibrio metschnikovii]MBC5849878.1 disulfide bond formation protein DsbB [Vibrio metschnikovii]PXA71028.1 disulfide bond formation protein DsbB [Vibrio sp. 11986-1-5]SUP08544.1 oxido-reductase [Vibrio metschnikovii]SUP51620.1 oxido-reductase [Vibrio metschnikovii]